MTVLPDYLQDQTEEAILERMLGRVPADIDKSEGSFIWDALAPSAYELFNSAVWAQEVLRRGFASTTFGVYLDMRCEEHGIARRAAVKATGALQVTGKPGTIIPAGTRVATPADPITNTASIEFETVGDGVTLDGTGVATVEIAAVEAGASGNVAAGAINVLVGSVPGVTGIINVEATSGGAEEESDASLLERLMLKIRSPGSSGNKADYIQWALQIDGIGGAVVEPLWNGPGTVKVYVIDLEKRAPNATLVAAVQNAIAPNGPLGDGKAPIGADVTVAAATEVPIQVAAKLTLRSGAGLADVQARFEADLTAYLKQLAFTDTVVRYTRIASVLLDIPEIVDFADLTVNGGTGYIELALGEVAVPGTVSFSV
jgi:uncharacterized phage protein gp47/JayE